MTVVERQGNTERGRFARNRFVRRGVLLRDCALVDTRIDLQSLPVLEAKIRYLEASFDFAARLRSKRLGGQAAVAAADLRFVGESSFSEKCCCQGQRSRNCGAAGLTARARRRRR